jgi:glycosyltransferase involved in cell wall biosynthesis
MAKSDRPFISVAICTYNPRADYLSRTLAALKSQTLPYSEWELLIVDNASVPAVAESVSLAWHSNARIVRETELGIANARIRAMREFAGDLLVFLDDDNVLAEDYLQRCAELFSARPDLGAVSGCLLPEYESAPPDWFAPYESWIAVRRITADTWSNFLDSRSEPVTAGMCLRRDITEAHINAARDNPLQRVLGSRGTSLLRGEDVAIVKSAIKLGYSVGQFTQLKLLHLIPKRRTEPAYLFSLHRHLCASGYLLSWVDNLGREPIRLSGRTLFRFAVHLIKGNQIRRRLVYEEFCGFLLARKIAKNSSNSEPQTLSTNQKMAA